MRTTYFRLFTTFLLFITFAGMAQDNPSFSLQVKDEINPYAIFSTFLMPGEAVTLETVQGNRNASYSLVADKGLAISTGPGKWMYTAPSEKGIAKIQITETLTGERMVLHAITMVPLSQKTGDKLNGYRIGNYPQSNNARYVVPKGLIEITEENADTPLSPHFQLNDFKCKQSGGYPKYIALRERLLLKLEMVIEQVNDQGYTCTGLAVMSGYRTPFYNKAIGNVANSRHVFGDASDVYIDENNDGQMDDLNKDGVSDKKDARVLYNIIDKLRNNAWYEPYIGGLGLYGRTSSHPAFVHVDVRGFVARWGL